MSERRAARGRAADPSQFPERLKSGPCIEDWADEDCEEWRRAYSARRNWRDAVEAWVKASGYRGNVYEACELARVGHPWGREFLIAQGRAGLAAFYDGKGPHP